MQGQAGQAPQWITDKQWLERQPDILVMAQEALPYVEGLLGLHERTSAIEAWEETNRTVERLKGAIAKEQDRRDHIPKVQKLIDRVGTVIQLEDLIREARNVMDDEDGGDRINDFVIKISELPLESDGPEESTKRN